MLVRRAARGGASLATPCSASLRVAGGALRRFGAPVVALRGGRPAFFGSTATSSRDVGSPSLLAAWRRGFCATSPEAVAAGDGDGVEASAASVVDEVEEPLPEAPLVFTSDMRPPKDSSRKWVQLDSKGRAYATGRRKTAVARVWVWPDPKAEVRINKMSLSAFCRGHWEQRFMILAPFFETGTAGKFSVMATVKGGGITGQAQALRLGVATAMQGLDAALRPTMKAAGYLKRDPRQRERMKPGQKGARKKFAWVKR